MIEHQLELAGQRRTATQQRVGHVEVRGGGGELAGARQFEVAEQRGAWRRWSDVVRRVRVPRGRFGRSSAVACSRWR